MNLIAFTGLPRAGKDTAAEYLIREHEFLRVAFADPLKEAAAVLLNRPLAAMRGEGGFDREAVLPEWGFSTRDFLQRFGTEAMRNNFGADFWIKHMRGTLSRLAQGHDRFVITDCRFANEAALVHELGGLVVLIDRPGCTASGHVSDAGVTEIDRCLSNDASIDRLYSQLDMLIAGQVHRADSTRRSAAQQS